MEWSGAKILLGVLGVLFLGLGAWGFSERSDRKRTEGARAALQDRYDTQGQDLEEATREGKETAARLARSEAGLRSLEQRFREEALAHRESADRALLERATLLEQSKQLELQAKELSEKVSGVQASLEKAQGELQQQEAVLAGERTDAKTLTKALHQEIDAARAVAKKNAEAVQKTRETAQTLQGELQRTSAAVQATESENEKLSKDLQRSANERDVATWTSQQLQVALNQALNLLQIREAELRALREQLYRARQDIERHHQTIKQQELTIQALNAELAKLKKPGP